jgi:hypothetical protein
VLHPMEPAALGASYSHQSPATAVHAYGEAINGGQGRASGPSCFAVPRNRCESVYLEDASDTAPHSEMPTKRARRSTSAGLHGRQQSVGLRAGAVVTEAARIFVGVEFGNLQPAGATRPLAMPTVQLDEFEPRRANGSAVEAADIGGFCESGPLQPNHGGLFFYAAQRG